MHLLLQLQLLLLLLLIIIIIMILFQELLLDDCQHENDEGNNHTQTETVGIKKCVHVILLFLFTWQSVYRVSTSAICIILLFLKTFFSMAARLLHIDKLRELANVFPRSLHLARKFLGNIRESFTKFVVCPQCHKLYRYNECWTQTGQVKETKVCSFVRFPTHTQRRMRSPCGEPLPGASEPLRPVRPWPHQYFGPKKGVSHQIHGHPSDSLPVCPGGRLARK